MNEVGYANFADPVPKLVATSTSLERSENESQIVRYFATMKHSAATNQIVVFINVDENLTKIGQVGHNLRLVSERTVKKEKN